VPESEVDVHSCLLIAGACGDKSAKLVIDNLELELTAETRIEGQRKAAILFEKNKEINAAGLLGEFDNDKSR